jgi:hypothetical protein
MLAILMDAIFKKSYYLEKCFIKFILIMALLDIS